MIKLYEPQEKNVKVHQQNRNELIRQLWCVLNDLSYLIPMDDYTKEDSDLWGFVTQHSAIQDRLGKAKDNG